MRSTAAAVPAYSPYTRMGRREYGRRPFVKGRSELPRTDSVGQDRPRATAPSGRAAGTSPDPEALADRLEQVTDALSAALRRREPPARILARHVESLRRVASSIRQMAMVFDANHAGTVARREAEIKAIATTFGQSIRQLAEANDTVRGRLGDGAAELAELAELPAGKEMTARLRRAVSHVREAADAIGQEVRAAAATVQSANERIASLERELEETRKRAERDGLTLLYSRGTLDGQLREVVSHGTADGQWCFLLADIDRFKSVNDSFGHIVGDALLFKVARIMEGTLRKERLEAFVARYGGEEFGVILHRAELDRAARVADSIRRAVASARWQFRGRDQQQVLRATISLGVAQYRRGDTPSSLVQRADDALYRAKHEGRNRVCVAPQ